MGNFQKKYSPDLRSFMAVSTTNYAKFMKLLPEMASISKIAPLTQVHFQKQPSLAISLLQASRYTQTVELKQQGFKQPEFQQGEVLKHLHRTFCVRVYHDAKMAEVLSGVHDSMLPPVFKQPNPEMKQVDEKAQLNRFLGEWLSFCLEYGEVDIEYKTQLAFLS
ncbi:DUF1249 domain-containing protein [Kangiella sp. HZ709]|uniref:DUF1249 domain-containing protein n=1 Tax=Kangiella sp. HZ709 TaxID=2666328 RepID=UPI0012B06867|nr:DUF1249 domain-containing protein [Kangiella sp. HZ709]MRX28538.1 DUF1249 domain-containing protein [Kangiella sp. HZ709]